MNLDLFREEIVRVLEKHGECRITLNIVDEMFRTEIEPDSLAAGVLMFALAAAGKNPNDGCVDYPHVRFEKFLAKNGWSAEKDYEKRQYRVRKVAR